MGIYQDWIVIFLFCDITYLPRIEAFNSPQASIVNIVASSFDLSLADWAHPSLICASLSGNIVEIPFDKRIIETRPNRSGLTQQVLWGLSNS
jgi:hypothetical protein